MRQERIKFDFTQLKRLIRKKYKDCTNICKLIGCSKGSLSKKLCNKQRFTSDNVYALVQALDISTEDIGKYFYKKLEK